MAVAFPPARRIATNGIQLAVHELGDGPAVLLLHGFPELAYSWRHQVPALAEAGYRVLAPDQRGYGDSDRPAPIEDYDIHHLTDDLLGILDGIGAEQAVFVGHDWGSMVVGQMALLHPERVRGVVAMSVPLLPRGPMAPVALMRQVLGDTFFYILYFQEPGVADADLGGDARETMTRMLGGVRVQSDDPVDLAAYAANDGRGFVERMPEVKELPGWLSQEELDHYVEVFTRTGFTGGINWYRNFDRNWETTPQLDGVHVTMPSAFITGSLDPVNVMTPAGVMDGHVLDHRGDTFVEGAGHWVQQEAPDEVNAALLSFLEALDKEGR